MNSSHMLGIAISVAAQGHRNQTDKGGKPYILHPIRMMMRLRTDDEELMAIAILHDVAEDCDYDLEDLENMGFSERIIKGVRGLTRYDTETYEEFIERCAQNPDSLRVKLEDLRDNSDITRLKGLREKDFARLEKYSRAFTFLKNYQETKEACWKS